MLSDDFEAVHGNTVEPSLQSFISVLFKAGHLWRFFSGNNRSVNISTGLLSVNVTVSKTVN